MKRVLFDLLRALVYATGFVLVWGWLALQVRPLDRRYGTTLPDWVTAAAIPLLVLGGVIVLACVLSFVLWGEGTPAPFDAPRRFVARGPYRFVRNPMYVGGGLVLFGFGLLERSGAILVLAAIMLMCAHLFVVLYEEPTLERRFGDDYRAYKGAVRRWWPRLGVTQ